VRDTVKTAHKKKYISFVLKSNFVFSEIYYMLRERRNMGWEDKLSHF
jgi:hypothetical protein